MITGIAHVCLNAVDLTATEAFYCAGLGLTKQFDFMQGDRCIGFYLAVGDGSFIEVFARDAVAPGGGIAHFCLEVDSVARTMAELDRRGLAHTEKKLGCDGSWQFWVTDPDGTRIEFHEYTAESSQCTGRTVSVDW